VFAFDGTRADPAPDLLQRYGARIPRDLMEILKVIWMVFDVAVLLDPPFNFYEQVRPYLVSIIWKRYSREGSQSRSRWR